MVNLGIIGTTTWGTTLAILNSHKPHEVTLFTRTKKESNDLSRQRSNASRTPDSKFPEKFSRNLPVMESKNLTLEEKVKQLKT